MMSFMAFAGTTYFCFFFFFASFSPFALVFAPMLDAGSKWSQLAERLAPPVRLQSCVVAQPSKAGRTFGLLARPKFSSTDSTFRISAQLLYDLAMDSYKI